jgi:Transmembrane family 220, helix
MNHRSMIYVFANCLMTVIFAWFMYLQFNDQNSVRWSIIYGVSALACFLYVIRRLSWHIPAVIGLVAIIWSLSKIPSLIGQDLPMHEVFGTMRMISEAVQEAREMLGLLIVFLWMLTLYFATRPARAPLPQ